MMKYSPSTGGFYDPSINGDSIPSDAVDVSNKEHAALIDSQRYGKHIAPGLGGLPVSIDKAPPSDDQLKADRISVIDSSLDAIDKKKIRAMTDAILSGDNSRLKSLEAQALALRTERKTLTGA
jgi:hypothetical protein